MAEFKTPENLKLRLLGEHPFAALVECYAQAGILVFPTLSDEWGLVMNEALAAGLPVLGSVYSQAVDELCVEGETGWRFRPDQPDEMEAAIDRALNTPHETLEQMRRIGRQRVEKLTPGYGAETFLAVISAALARARKT